MQIFKYHYSCPYNANGFYAFDIHPMKERYFEKIHVVESLRAICESTAAGKKLESGDLPIIETKLERYNTTITVLKNIFIKYRYETLKV